MLWQEMFSYSKIVPMKSLPEIYLIFDLECYS